MDVEYEEEGGGGGGGAWYPSCKTTASFILSDETFNSKLFITSEIGMENKLRVDATHNPPPPTFVLSLMGRRPIIVFPPNVIGSKFVCIYDEPGEDLLSILEPCTKWIHDAMHVSDAHVIVHCSAGISRSASVVIAYVMKYQTKSFKEALNIVRNGRSVIEPNSGFALALIEFEKSCLSF